MASPLWDTVFGEAAQQQIGDWPIADPLVEITNQGGFQSLDELGTAIVIALFSNATLPDSMVNQPGFTKDDKKVWHGNTFDIAEDEEELGSRLWELERSPITPDTARLAEYYASQALQTLVRQKKVSYFDISSTIDKAQGRINLSIVAYGPTVRTFSADLWPLR